MNPHVTLYLPGLLCNYMKETGLYLPFLFKMLSRSQKKQEKHDIQSGINYLFKGLEDSPLPTGALSALGQGLIEKDNTKLWCIASLVECLVTHQTAFLLGNEDLHLNEVQAKHLVQALNSLLNQDALNLSYTPSLHWLCSLEQHTQVTFTDLWDVLHKQLHSLLPKGPDSAYWQRLFTECQMLLEGERMNSHLPVASSLWFWGLGKLPQQIQTAYDMIYSNDDMIKGLAKLADKQVKPLAVEFKDEIFANHKNILIADLSFYYLYSQQLLNNWENKLEHFEKSCFDFLMQALMKGKIEKVTILTETATYSLSKMNLHFFWRKVRNPMRLGK